MAKQVRLSPDEISEKWNRRLKQAIPDIQKGVARVSDNPAELAIKKQEKMLNNLTRAVQDGKWAAGLKKVSLEDWKQKTIKKVSERMAGGVDAAMDKRKEFDGYLQKTLNEVLPKIADMPDMTLDDSVNRVRALMEHLHKNPYKK